MSLSAFAFLFSEMVQYFQSRVQNISDLESRCASMDVVCSILYSHAWLTHVYTDGGRLDDAGFGVGVRVIELLCHREKPGRRETRLINMLQVRV